jgi:hypothetical protein
MIKNKKVLLTVYLGGRQGAQQPSKQGKEVLRKVRLSPYEYAVIDAKGRATGKYVTPKGHYKAPDNFIPRPETICKKVILLQEECVSFFTSDEGKPYHIKKNVWEKMTDEERLKVNLQVSAESPNFSFEIID